MNDTTSAERHGYPRSPTPAIRAQRLKRAEEDGYEVVRADNYTLLLDLDTPEAERQYNHVRYRLMDRFPTMETSSWKSKSGNRHVMLHLKSPRDVVTRILLQACFGSDPVREALSLMDHENGEADPVVLFRPKLKVGLKAGDDIQYKYTGDIFTITGFDKGSIVAKHKTDGWSVSIPDRKLLGKLFSVVERGSLNGEHDRGKNFWLD